MKIFHKKISEITISKMKTSEIDILKTKFSKTNISEYFVSKNGCQIILDQKTPR